MKRIIALLITALLIPTCSNGSKSGDSGIINFFLLNQLLGSNAGGGGNSTGTGTGRATGTGTGSPTGTGTGSPTGTGTGSSTGTGTGSPTGTGAGSSTGTGTGSSTGTGTGGSTSVAPSISYSNDSFSFEKGTSITSVTGLSTTPSLSGTISNCVATPTLPSGLTINATTCVISGTPTMNQDMTTYTITVSNAYGNATANIFIRVEPKAQWAKTKTAGSAISRFNSSAVDSSGNIYAVGYIFGTATHTFNAGVTAAGVYSFGNSPVIVKYNSSGVAQWARTITTGSGAMFESVATDSSGNIYVVGTISGTSTYTFATGITATGTNNDSVAANPVLVKYNSSGTAQWARTITSGSTSSSFLSVAVDSSGNIYAVGYVNTGAFTFDSGISVTGLGDGVLLVKYNSSGTAQWARTQTGGSNYTRFNGIAIDSNANVYAVGYINGGHTYTFGTGVSVTGSVQSSFQNAVIVKYNSSGTAQWARTDSGNVYGSSFNTVTVDSNGNIYAAGSLSGNFTDSFGSGVTLNGSSSGWNAVLVKYDSSGTAQWAKSTSTGTPYSLFKSITVDSSGNIYAAGYIRGSSTTYPYTFGTGVGANTTNNNTTNSYNLVLVKYNSTGAANWAKSITIGSNDSEFNSVAIDSASGSIYCAGYMTGTSNFRFDALGPPGLLAAGPSGGNNVLLVQYK